MDLMKNLQELEHQVEDLILSIYDKCYVSKLSVIEIFNNDGIHHGYRLVLDLNNKEKPLEISVSGTEEVFLKIIKELLKFSDLLRTLYFYGDKFYKKDEQPTR